MTNEITIPLSEYEHLLNCLANQKFIHEFNTQFNIASQKTIDDALNAGMKRLEDKHRQITDEWEAKQIKLETIKISAYKIRHIQEWEELTKAIYDLNVIVHKHFSDLRFNMFYVGYATNSHFDYTIGQHYYCMWKQDSAGSMKLWRNDRFEGTMKHIKELMENPDNVERSTRMHNKDLEIQKSKKDESYVYDSEGTPIRKWIV